MFRNNSGGILFARVDITVCFCDDARILQILWRNHELVTAEFGYRGLYCDMAFGEGASEGSHTYGMSPDGRSAG